MVTKQCCKQTRWLRCIAIVFCLFVFCTSTVCANSAPVYWEGNPSAESLVLDTNTPITVVHEQLTFDFTGDVWDSWHSTGLVTAQYEMQNPTDQAQQVQMAFPFVGNYYDVCASVNQMQVTANGTPVETVLYFGDVTSDDVYEQYKIESIVQMVENSAVESKCFTSDMPCTRYTFTANVPTSLQEENVSLYVEFETLNPETFVLCVDGNSYSGESDGTTRFGKHIDDGETFTVYVIGEQAPYTVIARNAESKSLDSVTYNTDTQTMTFQDMIQGFVEQSKVPPMLDVAQTQTQLYNAFIDVFDEVYVNGQGAFLDEINSYIEHETRVMVLCYTVPFAANETQTVTVQYVTNGTSDKRKTPTPVHSYTYLFEPATYWASFGDIEVELFTPDHAPYLAYNNAPDPVLYVSDQHYRAQLTQIPQEPFEFSLYASGTIEELTEWQLFWEREWPYIWMLIQIVAMFLVPIAIVIVPIVMIIKCAKKKK